MARRIGRWVLLPWLLGIGGCGRTLGEQASLPLGDAGATAGSGGSDSHLTGGTGGGGVAAGGQQGSAGTGGQGYAGAGGARFDSCAHQQELVGNWVSINLEHTEPTPGHVDECSNLSLSASSSASGLWAFTWLPAPPVHTSFVEFDTNGGVVGDGSFLIRDEFAGPVVVDYLSACLTADTGAVGCEQLSNALLERGTLDETYDQVACVTRADGCRCTFQVSYAKLMGGFYSFQPTVGELAFFNLNAGNGTAESSYCISQAGLRFGVGFEQLSRFSQRLLYTRVDCSDGQQGPSEAGPDCGPACNAPCP